MITSLGEEGAGLCASRALFVVYVLDFVVFLFLLVSGIGCGLGLWHSRDFSINLLDDCQSSQTILLNPSLNHDVVHIRGSFKNY